MVEQSAGSPVESSLDGPLGELDSALRRDIRRLGMAAGLRNTG